MNKILLIAVGTVATLTVMAANETQTQPAAGTAAPDFSLMTSDRSKVSLKDFSGKCLSISSTFIK
jgi:peroxiredoxin